MSSNGSRENLAVSAFDLEPNPFEQSFASTKDGKKVIRPASAAAPAANREMGAAATAAGPLATGSLAGGNLAPSNLGASSSLAQPVPLNSLAQDKTALNNVPAPAQNTSGVTASLQHAGLMRTSSIQSPHGLTPGGSRKLPPLLVSPRLAPDAPNLAAAAGASAAGPNVPHSTSHGVFQGPHLLHSNNTSLLPNAGNGTTTPSFFLNLTKSGLSPNESSIRTGLTPAILTHSTLAPDQHPTGPPVTLPAAIGEGQFTPGFSSLLGLSLGEKSFSDQAPSIESGTIQDPLQAGLPIGLPDSVPTTVTNSSLNSSKTSVSTTAANSNSSSTPSNAGDSSRNSSNEKKQMPLEPPAKKQKSVGPKSTPSMESQQDSVSENSHHDQERKRQEFLERNRVAASKFRKRKKEYIKKIEADLQFYEAEYDDFSQCMDKLCGISKQTTNSSLVGHLKQALLRQDLPTALTLCTGIEQVLLQSRYVQRCGKNPRREEDENRRRKSLKDESYANSELRLSHDQSFSSGVRSMSVDSKEGLPLQQAQNHTKNVMDKATGTISNLPLVINGNTLLSLDDIQRAQQKESLAPRHGSLSNLQQHDSIGKSPALPQYPNSN
ncbi:LAMI_0H00650g1_1 [Lachancea mirantina]|uniref:LAMI_0H00650g1_1 n=1 Tax=Lachancea mirantina TaxID=1230905 RepID=A0A1G4KDM2_9SACH|nr:LAMI_0H00650g1_1 [Lachancea mirantina]